MRGLAILASAAALACPVAAQAEWLEASSPNFVVYADDSERDIGRFAQQLELYHQAMERMTGNDLPEPSPSNRVTVYVVKNEKQVQQLYGDGAKHLTGFYVPRAAGSFAIIPQVDAKAGQPDNSMLVLLHEYAHHFLISNSRMPPPRWVGEGSAEFFASAEFPKAGGIKIGMPAYHRAGELFYAKDVKVAQLLDPTAYSQGAQKGFDAFYGKSWLLYHYLTLGQARPGQLRQYLTLMGRGKSSQEAGLEAFGDLDVLEKELDRYLSTGRMLTAVFGADVFTLGQIAVRTTGVQYEGRAQMLDLYALRYGGAQFMVLTKAVPAADSPGRLTTRVTATTPAGKPIDHDAVAQLLALFQRELPAEITRVRAQQAAEKAAAQRAKAQKARKRKR